MTDTPRDIAFLVLFLVIGFPTMFAFSWWWTRVCIRFYRRWTR